MSSHNPSSPAATPADEFDDFADPETWARHSPYSPFNLHHLPQPVPRDIQQEPGNNAFTFRDAFEDLMLSSSGRSLPQGPDLLAQKLHIDFMFANGMPVSNWVRMLNARGLWAPYFPRQQLPRPAWEDSNLGSEIASMLLDWGVDAGWFPGRASDQERHGRFQTSHKALENSGGHRDKNEPSTEEDIYEHAGYTSPSRSPRYQSPWDMMVEALREAGTTQPPPGHAENNTSVARVGNSHNENTNTPKETEKSESCKTWDGGRVDKVWKTREYDGKIETIETQHKYDASGKLVGQWESTKVKTVPSMAGTRSDGDDGEFSTSSSSSSRWSRTWSHGNNNVWEHQDRDGSGSGDDKGHDGDGTTNGADGRETGQKPGWFWTK
ncbi:hypothetical protein MN608_00128 [Microdochium nivale]|nr:hypothetical protein MN608_00128 [Microdochium nivale]